MHMEDALRDALSAGGKDNINKKIRSKSSLPWSNNAASQEELRHVQSIGINLCKQL